MSAAPQLDKSEQLTTLIDKVNDLAVLPHVVFKVLEISGNDDCAPIAMEKAIVVDPGFSTKLLTWANSSYYGLPRKVSSIRDAIGFLGFKAVRQLAMSVGVFDLFVGKNDQDSLRRRTWWRHSVDTAICAKYLALRTRKASPDDAYTCGLLHLMGKTLLDRFGEKDYKIVEALIEKGASCEQAELALYGLDHVTVGIAAAEKWGFPEILVGGFIYNAEPEADDPSGPVRSTVAIANKIVHYALEGVHENGIVDRSLPLWALSRIGLDPNQTLDIIEAGTAAIVEASKHTQ